MLKTIAIVLVVLIAGVLILASTKPDQFRVSRSLTIQAPPEKIFPLINDFHQWAAWSPYEKLDPNMKRTLSGPLSGQGASYAWAGNSNAGAGRMQITDSQAPSKIAIDLNFEKPMKASNVAVFDLVPEGNSTRVTWSMEGPVPFFAKIFHVFMNMDRLIGKDFETGLANLKALTEK